MIRSTCLHYNLSVPRDANPTFIKIEFVRSGYWIEIQSRNEVLIIFLPVFGLPICQVIVDVVHEIKHVFVGEYFLVLFDFSGNEAVICVTWFPRIGIESPTILGVISVVVSLPSGPHVYDSCAWHALKKINCFKIAVPELKVYSTKFLSLLIASHSSVICLGSDPEDVVVPASTVLLSDLF